MTYRTIRVILLIFLSVIICNPPSYAAPAKLDKNNSSSVNSRQKPRFRDGELIVKFRKKTTEREQGEVSARIHKKHGATRHREFKKLRMQQVKLKKGMTVEQAIELYKNDPDVEYAEPDYIVQLDTLPDDPMMDQLWNMTKIAAPQAWNSSTGSNDVVVATVDSGIDYNHPDLAANIWVNQAELNGLPGVDDDGNGVIDDIHGLNAIVDSGDPLDDEGHGTHVAGIIGAVGDNTTGVAGVNWNVKLLACKFTALGGLGYTTDAIQCLQYIKDLKATGVNIVAVNHSWSGPNYSQALYDVIADMPEVLNIAAAGNLGNDTGLIPRYPSALPLPNIITVASTSSEDTRSEFSNYNRYLVHAAAPGQSITSSVSGRLAGDPPVQYKAFSGTSQAAPHVAGLAALIKAQDSSRDGWAIKNLILSSGDPLPTLDGTTLSGRRINAERALNCTDAPLFSLLEVPRAMTVGVPRLIRALSINCGLPAGPVQMNINGIGTILLNDNGLDGDQFSGDGVFSVNWTPPDDAVRVITITAVNGSASFQSKPMSFTSPANLTANLIADNQGRALLAPASADMSFRFTVSGGQNPHIWVVSQGTLPTGLLLDPATGVVSGSATQDGSFDFTVQVTDNLGYSIQENWRLNIVTGLRNGWPKELLLRSEIQASYPPVFADLNGDGKQEIIVADGTFLYVYGESGRIASRNLGYLVSAPAVADIDGDGIPEIVVGFADETYSGPALPLRIFNADLTPKTSFIPADIGGMHITGRSPAIADLDGDGQPEIIQTVIDRAINVVQIYAMRADGTPLAEWPVFVEMYTGNNPDKRPAIADIDFDGLAEIVYPDDVGSFHVIKPNGSKVSKDYSGGIRPDFWTKLHTPMLQDINNDGSPEIILNMGSYDLGRILVFTGDGSRTSAFENAASQSAYFYTTESTSYTLADLDGDGFSELIYVHFAGTEGQYELHAIRQDGTSLADWPILLPLFHRMPPGFNQPVVADITGDGRPEVLLNLAPYTETAKGYVYENPYLTAYGVDGLVSVGFPKQVLKTSFLRTSPAVGDLDGDGKPDIALKSDDGRLYLFGQSVLSSLANAPWPMYGANSSLTSFTPPPPSPDSVTIDPLPRIVSTPEVTVTGTRPAGIDVLVHNVTIGVAWSPDYPTDTTWSAVAGMAEGENLFRIEGSNGRKAIQKVFLLLPEFEAPVVNFFTMPETSTSLTVPVTMFTANDNVGVTAYLITQSSTPPPASAVGWSTLPPASFTFGSLGNQTAYAWAKDANGNVSVAAPEATAAVLITLPVPVNGSCGGAHGQSFAEAPSENLCTLGSATTVTSDMGLWKWSCSGLNNGTPAACTATVTVTPGTPVQITSGSGNYPAINDIGEIVWVHADPVTFAEQVRSNVRGVVLDDGHNRANLAVNNLGDLVWTESVDGNGQIFSRINGVTNQVTSDATFHDNPVITDSGEIFWNQWDTTIQVYSHLRGALTSDNTDHSYLSVNNRGDMVWYQGAEGIGGMVAGSPLLIPTVTGYDPVINDQREIVWNDSNSSGNTRMFSNTRGELASTWRQDALYHYQPTMNSCGDVAFVFYTNDNTGDGIYRLGDASPCGSESEPNETLQQAASINNGSVMVATLNSASDAEDWYAFGAAAGTPIALRVNWDASGTNALTVELHNASGTLLSTASGTGFGKTLSYTPTVSGIYNLRFIATAGTKFGYAVKTSFAPWTPPVENGACGSSHNKTFSTVPSANLCTAGTPSAVSGSGPWGWTCAGLYGGATATCSASLSVPVPVGATVVNYPTKPGSTFSVYRYEAGKSPELLYSGSLTSYIDTSSRLPNTIYRYTVSSDLEGASDVLTIHTPLYNGWNIVGVPYDTTGIAAATLFGGPVSAVYEWIPTSNINPDNSGDYSAVATLTPGKGYFVKAGNSSTLMAYSGAVNPAGVNVVLKPGYTLISNTQTTNMTNIGTNWLIDGAPLATYINAIPPKIGGAVYWWNGINYDSWNILDVIPAMQPVIEPWKAYWLLNLDTINHTLTIQ